MRRNILMRTPPGTGMGFSGLPIRMVPVTMGVMSKGQGEQEASTRIAVPMTNAEDLNLGKCIFVCA